MGEHFDVVVVGAGLSGIGAAVHLQKECPDRSFVLLEGRDDIGGTWDLFRYPGIRSDSDLHTFGYAFKPWTDDRAIADGESIRAYITETARENGIDRHIRFGHRVVRADWSSEDARWTVEVQRCDSGERVQMTCDFLFGCCGYYRYDGGYTPELEGTERFRGRIVHPQHWPQDVDYRGKRVVVIGSGATAVTLVPAMAAAAEHVTMLQRSPSYVVSLPGRDPIAHWLRRFLPPRLVYPVVRWKNVLLTMLSFQLSRRRPRLMKALIRKGVQSRLPQGYDVDTHFRPSYDPWDQRLCLVPDDDLFKAIGRGDASVVTDRIETFTEGGIRLASGEELEADLIVTATGLNLQLLGGIEVAVDGEDVEFSEHLMYKGMMISDVPNLAIAIGYTNASWTLKCELTCEYVCRLLNEMRARRAQVATPRNRDSSLQAERLIDFNSGYVLRSIDKFPRQGSRAPWRLHQNYARDILLLRHGTLADEALEFETVAA